MSLQDWLKSRWLIEHQTSRQEIVDLLSMADRDLAQCRTPQLDDRIVDLPTSHETTP